MIALRRRTRETLRHERAVVLQELAAPPVALVQQDWVANRQRAAELRRRAEDACHYCGIVGGHRADCPVISKREARR